MTSDTSQFNSADIAPELKRRVLITSGCRDCDYIPKVPGSGAVTSENGGRLQLMHNGVKVVADGYCGKWMTELIRLLDGHHEPQEEKIFHEVLKLLPQGAIMIELGSYWGYYSLWFQRVLDGARNYLIEPDPNNLAVGKKNFELNHANGEFFQYSVGKVSLPPRPFSCESDGDTRLIAEISVDDFVRSQNIPRVDLLLSDIQGAELSMLEGALDTITRSRLRFVFLSTHHHSISQDPLTHQRCLSWIEKHGGHIIAAHSVTESYSGDGLIVASFDPADRQIEEIEVSRNHPTNSLFRELEYDLDDAQQQLRAIKQSRAFRLSSLVGRIKARLTNLVS